MRRTLQKMTKKFYSIQVNSIFEYSDGGRCGGDRSNIDGDDGGGRAEVDDDDDEDLDEE